VSFLSPFPVNAVILVVAGAGDDRFLPDSSQSHFKSYRPATGRVHGMTKTLLVCDGQEIVF
jgi:hypothetical protein